LPRLFERTVCFAQYFEQVVGADVILSHETQSGPAVQEEINIACSSDFRVDMNTTCCLIGVDRIRSDDLYAFAQETMPIQRAQDSRCGQWHSAQFQRTIDCRLAAYNLVEVFSTATALSRSVSKWRFISSVSGDWRPSDF
jgi:hypothetical protein